MTSILILSCAAFVAVGSAQTSVTKRTGYANKIGMPRAGLSAQDMSFIEAAAAGNSFEIESSKIALSNGSSTFVKQFAKEMVADHVPAYDELHTAAMKHGVTTSTALPPKLATTIAKLKTLHGAVFDAAYLKAQKDGHAETAMKMEGEIKMGHDSGIKNYALKTLPTVKMHQRMLMSGKTQMGMTKMKHGL